MPIFILRVYINTKGFLTMISGVGSADLRVQLEELKAAKKSAESAEVNASDNKNTKEANKTGAEAGKTTAQTAQGTAAANKTDADNAVTQAKSVKNDADATYEIAKNATESAKATEISAGTAWESAKTALSYAKNQLEAAMAAATADNPNTEAINAAKAAVKQAETQESNAKKAFEEAIQARENAEAAEAKAKAAAEAADAALEAAESNASDAAKKLEDANKALEEAQEALEKAIDELEEAEVALEDAKKAVTDADAAVVEKENELKEAEAAEARAAEEAKEGNPLKTEEDAISEGYTIIKSFEDLQKIGNNVGGKYILMGDIDIPDGVNWTPIGDANSPFTGEFNGNGCNIKNLNIAVQGDDVQNVGFFGVTDGATIKDVTFVDATVNGNTEYLGGTYNTGILAGCIKRTTVTGVNVEGYSSVSGYANTGGLIGNVDDRDYFTAVSTGNSYIENCHTDVEVNGKYASGGLIGYVTGTADRLEDHRGIVNKSLIIRDCSTSGSATVDDESVGGLIGETGKTLVTIDKCTSDMSLTWTNEDGLGDLSFLLETGRIGGLVGNINGTYITLANCEFDGSLNGETEFQSEVYGWYMDDSHVCIYDLPDGLPVDDILNINGIDGMKLNSDGKYECTVSTLSGLDKMVSMIKENPSLADQVVFVVNFDFNAMDGQYTYSEYAQYGIVQHLYEDEDGNVHNDVYIDNECDLETTYHSPEPIRCDVDPCECNYEIVKPTMVSGLYKTMVPGLDKDEQNYCVMTSEGLKTVNLKINADNQITDVKTRLTESEVKYRDKLVELGKSIQQQMRDILKDMYNWNSDESVPILTKAEYKQLLKKAEKYGFNSLSDAEKLGMAIFEVDYNIMNAQSKYTKNLGCGMGGNASFLDKTTTYQMYDANGNALYTTLDGDQLIKDENGNYAYADGSGSYFGMGEVYEQRGYQKTDDDGNLLFTYNGDGTSSTVKQIKGEDGKVSYVTTDAEGNQVPFEGNVADLEKQLTPANYSEDYDGFEKELNNILQDVKDGKFPSCSNETGTEQLPAEEKADEQADETDVETEQDDDKDKEEII